MINEKYNILLTRICYIHLLKNLGTLKSLEGQRLNYYLLGIKWRGPDTFYFVYF